MPRPSKQPTSTRGAGGETHQVADEGRPALTTNQGTTIADNQNSLRAGVRGPTLLEDFILREKITHFDHERIPERVVHARGYGAKGYFQSYASHTKLTKAAFLTDPRVQTPVFVRFSTVAGSKGSLDTARDVRGFAVKFYTSEGNFDLVSNNIPVFFIQDAIKFPDLIHSVKPEPDRGFPQAQSAHDTFWDFAAHNPEIMHMLTWVMSDRAIPRSFRMMEGFAVHTFRMVNAAGESSFVKFHWRPTIPSCSLVWDEAVKLGGADPDFHRRDLWEAIETGNYPEYELCVQVFDQATADSFDFDILDATKLIPEERVPLTRLGKMVLDRNVDEFFAETEQVAFCPSHLVPGVEFTDDPLLQGRLFSYLDTQLKRLGGPNFHEIEVNRPVCPWHNLQRGGHMRQRISTGRVSYEPASLDQGQPREDPRRGFTTVPAGVGGVKLRARAESFADHYTQARMFYISQTAVEQRHMHEAFAFELGKVDAGHVRRRMLGHLQLVHAELGEAVARALGMQEEAERIVPAWPVNERVEPSPALSLYANYPEGIAGKRLGVLMTDGTDTELLQALIDRAQVEGANLHTVAPTRAGVRLAGGEQVEATHALAGGPSVLFDAVVLAPGPDAVAELLDEPAALEWVRDAWVHQKAIGHVAWAEPLIERAVLGDRRGVVEVAVGRLDELIAAAGRHRVWEREVGPKRS